MDLVSSERLMSILLSAGEFKDRGLETHGESFESHLASDPALQNDVQSLLEYLGYSDNNCSTDAEGTRQTM